LLLRLGFCLAVTSFLLPQDRPAVQPKTPEAYRLVVSEYRQSGRRAVEELHKWTAAQLTVAIDRAIDDDKNRWSWQELPVAAALHTDVWFTCVLTKCGGDMTATLAAAERLLDRVVQVEPRQADYTDRWYATISGLLRHVGRREWSEELLRRRRLRLSPSPSRQRALAAYTRGLQFEYDGSMNGQLLTSSGATIGDPSDPLAIGAWNGAASAYHDALGFDPDFLGAALHLGRVRLVQGNRSEAGRLFALAMQANDPRVAYLANLFLGSLSEVEGRFDEAARLYGEAFRIYPSGQAAAMALAQVFSRTGREGESRSMLSTFMRSGYGRAVEPLWTYLMPPRLEFSDLAAALDELRVEAVQ
jgi:tetratricopeptide (TPR) repeat protein